MSLQLCEICSKTRKEIDEHMKEGRIAIWQEEEMQYGRPGWIMHDLDLCDSCNSKLSKMNRDQIVTMLKLGTWMIK